jgi:hypothetical protein
MCNLNKYGVQLLVARPVGQSFDTRCGYLQRLVLCSLPYLSVVFFLCEHGSEFSSSIKRRLAAESNIA